ncbi:hypothetical protein AHAS_Ahas13G0094000 [Arachis hypogaea]
MDLSPNFSIVYFSTHKEKGFVYYTWYSCTELGSRSGLAGGSHSRLHIVPPKLGSPQEIFENLWRLFGRVVYIVLAKQRWLLLCHVLNVVTEQKIRSTSLLAMTPSH